MKGLGAEIQYDTEECTQEYSVFYYFDFIIISYLLQAIKSALRASTDCKQRK